MREAFTSQLRRVLDRAQAVARERQQDFVSTEHLLLAIIDCDACEIGSALRRNEIDAEELRQTLLRALPRGEEPPVVVGDLPLTPRAKRAIHDALVKAQAAREDKVSSRLVLLALLDEQDTAIRQALRDVGSDIDQLQRLLAESPAKPEE